jgi:hypothetical protein
MGNFRQVIGPHIDAMPLINSQKNVIKDRFVTIVEEEKKAYRRNKIIYTACRFFITIGSVASVLTVMVGDNIDLTDSQKTILAWITVALNVMNVIANTIMSDGLSKKYVLSESLVEKLQSEGWSFITGTKSYDGVDDISERFRVFVARIEKIKLKSVENAISNEANQATGMLGTAADSHSDRAMKRSKKILSYKLDDSATTVPDASEHDIENPEEDSGVLVVHKRRHKKAVIPVEEVSFHESDERKSQDVETAT